MPAEAPGRLLNRLLEGLPYEERRRVLDDLEPVSLGVGAVLCAPGQRFRHIYFPVTALISLTTTVSGHEPLEIRMIGNEGVLGATLVLGIGIAPLRSKVQASGAALRMSVPRLRRGLPGYPALRRTLNRYLYALLVQLSRTVACARFHEVEARLARCLLMRHDRAHADHLRLTHQSLAAMLGVRRSAVTIAAGALQKRKLISYVRGEISILSRAGLEAVSCECYKADFDDFLDSPPDAV